MRLSYLILAFTLIFSSSIHADYKYRIINLHPPGAAQSWATDINEHGQVVGFYQPNKLSPTFHAFIWDKTSGFQFIGETTRKPLMNNLGHVIGARKTSQGVLGFLYRNGDQPFIWKPETGVQLIEKPPGAGSADIIPHSITDHDQLLINNHMEPINSNKAWVWREGEWEKITGMRAAHLSNEQKITGTFYSQGRWLPVQNDLPSKIFTPIFLKDNNFSGVGQKSNSKGEMLGYYYLTSNSNPISYFFWSPITGFKELPKGFVASKMNNNGEILGVYKDLHTLTPMEMFYLYDGENLLNIENNIEMDLFASDRFFFLKEAEAINDRRQIVGSGHVLENGLYINQAFLIEPIE